MAGDGDFLFHSSRLFSLKNWSLKFVILQLFLLSKSFWIWTNDLKDLLTVNPPPKDWAFWTSFFEAGSVLAQSLFVMWLKSWLSPYISGGSVLICHMAQSWLSPYLSCGSILAHHQSLFIMWLNPGSFLICPVAQPWLLIFPMAQSWPGMSHGKN